MHVRIQKQLSAKTRFVLVLKIAPGTLLWHSSTKIGSETNQGRYIGTESLISGSISRSMINFILSYVPI